MQTCVLVGKTDSLKQDNNFDLTVLLNSNELSISTDKLKPTYFDPLDVCICLIFLYRDIRVD